MTEWTPRTVLLAGPSSDDSFAENISATLGTMGIRVLQEPGLDQSRYVSRWRKAVGSINDRLRRDYISPSEKWMIQAAREHHPDLFLAPSQVIKEETLVELKRAGVRACVAWWGDPPAYMGRIGLLTDGWDLIFIKDPDCVLKFKRVGLNAHLLHEAMNPLWHRPVAHQANDCIVVAGNFYEYRQFLVRRMLAKGIEVQLYGGRMPRWIHSDLKKLHTRKYIVRLEKSRIMGEGLACLNSTQIVEGNSLNCRAFEISGAGGLQLMEYRPIIQECFEPGREILTFDSIDELLDLVERAKKNPDEMTAIRLAAARRALAHHTYRHRLEEIFRLAGEI